MDKTVKFKIELETNGQKVLDDVAVSTGELRAALVEVGNEGHILAPRVAHYEARPWRAPYPHATQTLGLCAVVLLQVKALGLVAGLRPAFLLLPQTGKHGVTSFEELSCALPRVSGNTATNNGGYQKTCSSLIAA